MNYFLLFIGGVILHLIWGSFKIRKIPKFRLGEAGDFGGGKKKSESTQVATQTEEEKELNKLNLELRRKAQPGLIDVQESGLDLASMLLGGGQLPGYLERLPGGISPEVTQRIVDESLEDVATSAQFGGILDSGVAKELATEASSDIRTQSEQFNLQILQNLLSAGLGGQMQIQQPITTQSGQLSQALAGLRPITQTGRTKESSWAFQGTELAKAGAGMAAAAIAASDKKLKKNIKYITNNKLQLATWKWNDIANKLYGLSGNSCGYIAQDVQKIYPDAVIKDRHGYLMIDYNKLADKVA